MLHRAGIPVERVAKVSEHADNVAELIRGGPVDLVINTPFGRGARTDGYFIRTASASAGVPCVTTLPGVFAAVRGHRGAARAVDRAAFDPGVPCRGDAASRSRPG